MLAYLSSKLSSGLTPIESIEAKKSEQKSDLASGEKSRFKFEFAPPLDKRYDTVPRKFFKYCLDHDLVGHFKVLVIALTVKNTIFQERQIGLVILNERPTFVEREYHVIDTVESFTFKSFPSRKVEISSYVPRYSKKDFVPKEKEKEIKDLHEDLLITDIKLKFSLDKSWRERMR